MMQYQQMISQQLAHKPQQYKMKHSRQESLPIFEPKASIIRRKSRASVNKICLNDLFEEPKIQVKIPHTLIAMNIATKGPRVSNKQQRMEHLIYQRGRNFQSKYNRYFQTYKRLQVPNTYQQERLNTKIEQACRELSREGISNPSKCNIPDFRRSMVCRKYSMQQQRLMEDRYKIKRESMSVEFKPIDRDLLASFSYFDENKMSLLNEEKEVNKSLHLSKRKVSDISINSKSLKLKELGNRPNSRSKRYSRRQNIPSQKPQVQPICGWNLDQPQQP